MAILPSVGNIIFDKIGGERLLLSLSYPWKARDARGTIDEKGAAAGSDGDEKHQVPVVPMLVADAVSVPDKAGNQCEAIDVMLGEWTYGRFMRGAYTVAPGSSRTKATWLGRRG